MSVVSECILEGALEGAVEGALKRAMEGRQTVTDDKALARVAANAVHIQRIANTKSFKITWEEDTHFCNYTAAQSKTFDPFKTSDVDDCASSPCQNNGTCVDDVNSYTCQCDRNYVGNNCQTGEETPVNKCVSDINTRTYIQIRF